MSRLILTDAFGDGKTVIVVLDDERMQTIYNELGSWGYEGDEVLYFAATDGWVELSWDAGVFIGDVVVAPRGLFENLSEPAVRDPRYRRLLRASLPYPERPVAVLDGEGAVLVWRAEPGTSDEDIIRAIENRDDWPIIFSSGPPSNGAGLVSAPSASG